jgi:hypothetical protein
MSSFEKILLGLFSCLLLGKEPSITYVPRRDRAEVADGVRFELTEELPPRRFSRPVLSTAQPPIQ